MLQLRHHHHHHQGGHGGGIPEGLPPDLPLVVSLNCLEDTSLEAEGLSGVAMVEHVGLGRIAEGRIESAAAVIVQSLAFLPRAAQRRLQPWQLIVCLGSADRSVDTALAADLGLRMVHVDANRAEEVADTVMALFLGLLRRTHLLSRHVSSSAAASGWLGSIQPLCRGMRRCRGLVLGIVGRSASAKCLATRSLAFRMSVLYFDVQEGNENSGRPLSLFPRAARRMDTLNDLLAASDLVSLHCALTDETIQIINEECLQHIKPGAFIVNTGSSQLIDDCALKQLLIDGTVAGCALDGAEGPQWMEAWVREMPNVLILPRSADYSEEVWMEIRRRLFPHYILSSMMGSEAMYSENDSERRVRTTYLQADEPEQQTDAILLEPEYTAHQLKDSVALSQHSTISESSRPQPSEGRRGRSGKKGKKRPARRRSQRKSDEFSAAGDSNSTLQRDQDTAISGSRDQAQSSSSRFASPEDARNKQICLAIRARSQLLSVDDLKEGYVVVLHPKDRPGLHASRQRAPGGGWFLEVMTNVTRRDPAAQFLITFTTKGAVGLGSFSAGGKLLQTNRKTEMVFAGHSLDGWASWILDGSILEDCKLVNIMNPLAALDVWMEIVAVVDEDGVTRWLG
ncbi:unnamed protein product [Spirodela intermedia]|uniref:D-isomer specific 2-hydroxyacid dehydrogenase NAD-binding domain-containing protein n=1 Tax=Spirodela intermedia TaxID=51605 RepID=A0A7I8IFB0_SPIIN|nr:unnamed protein product [Spirodela intermedia]CAA6656477.1 unnamed protein product [Spirodela intermedia]